MEPSDGKRNNHSCPAGRSHLIDEAGEWKESWSWKTSYSTAGDYEGSGTVAQGCDEKSYDEAHKSLTPDGNAEFLAHEKFLQKNDWGLSEKTHGEPILGRGR